MEINQEIIGARLRSAREQAGLTQTEGALAVGAIASVLNQYETGQRHVDSLTLERLSRLYGVPLGSFVQESFPHSDWEDALRSRASVLPVEAKVGIGLLIEHLRDLEELYRRTDTPFPLSQHPPSVPLRAEDVTDQEVAAWAERVRRHLDLGGGSLPAPRSLLEAQGYRTFAVPLGCGDDALTALLVRHPDLGPVITFNADQTSSRRTFTLSPEERLPPVFLELAYQAARTGTLSPRRVAEMLGISDLELEERLDWMVADEDGSKAVRA